MDDTFVIQKEIHKHNFIQHINSVDPAIQFAVENNKEDGAITFLDTIVKPEADGNLSITVYRKPKAHSQAIMELKRDRSQTSTHSGTVTTTSQQS